MQLSIDVTAEKFNKQKYMTDVRAQLTAVFIQAGRRFLLAATPLVPVWTGMARGAFRNAEDVFGKVSQDKTSGIRIRGTRGGSNKDGKFRRGYYYYPPGGGRVERSPNRGRDYSTPAAQIMGLQGVSIARGKSVFYLRFKVDITYFNILDKKWGAMQAGIDAAEAYIRDNINLPNPMNYMTPYRFVIK